MLASRYSIKKILGEGASSTVYLAYDMEESAEVAIKSQTVEHAREHLFLGRTDHENIVKLKNFIKGERHAYLVIEKCDCNLISFINNYEYDTKCIKKIMRMILLGIKYLHDNRIIHRDIKLGNILIKNDTVKICDLGLSCYFDENDYSYCGTRDYLAPEILNCKNNHLYRRYAMREEGLERVSREGMPRYDSKVDIYAAGVVFKVLVCRKKGISLGDLPDLDEDLRIFLKKLLHSNPNERYSASSALKDQVFSELFTDVPDFRLIKNFYKKNKYGEIRREANYAEIKYKQDDSGSNQTRKTEGSISFPNPSEQDIVSIKIEYLDSPCNCKSPFLFGIRLNGRVIDKEFLTNNQLKYYNYICSYMRILCEKTLRTRLVERGTTFSLFLNGSILYSTGSMQVGRSADRKTYTVNGKMVKDVPRRYKDAIEEHLGRCMSTLANSCICFSNRLEETKSTVQLSIGRSEFAEDRQNRELEIESKWFLEEIGWCIKSGLKFIFLLNGGTSFTVNANRQTIIINEMEYNIDHNLNEEIKDLLKITAKFLHTFY